MVFTTAYMWPEILKKWLKIIAYLFFFGHIPRPELKVEIKIFIVKLDREY